MEAEMILEPYEQWNGTIEELARVAAEVLTSLGRRDSQAPNVRLIRDYVQRGIMSPSERRGKKAYYGISHLQELVAARILVSDGVPLAKIAEQFQRDRDLVMVTLGLTARDRQPDNPARARWKQLAADSMKQPLPMQALESFIDDQTASNAFMRKTLEDTGQKQDMQQRLARLGSGRPEPRVDRMVRLTITEWCSLLIDAERLSNLTTEQAEDIGRSISTALIDPRIKKGASS
jgi:DNA-binding transcriptional MerR regulator